MMCTYSSTYLHRMIRPTIFGIKKYHFRGVTRTQTFSKINFVQKKSSVLDKSVSKLKKMPLSSIYQKQNSESKIKKRKNVEIKVQRLTNCFRP